MDTNAPPGSYHRLASPADVDEEAALPTKASAPTPIKAPAPQTIFKRRPSCNEMILFPTPIIYALVFGGLNYGQCPAIPHLTVFVMVCSTVALLNEILRFIFRLALAPWDEPRSCLMCVSSILQAGTVVLACWGAWQTFPEAARLHEGGGAGCNMTAFLTGFLVAALTLLANLVIFVVLACRACAKPQGGA